MGCSNGTSPFFMCNMSRPEISLHKISNVMKDKENQYVRRSQKDYNMSFKLSVVSEIERGEINTTHAL